MLEEDSDKLILQIKNGNSVILEEINKIKNKLDINQSVAFLHPEGDCYFLIIKRDDFSLLEKHFPKISLLCVDVDSKIGRASCRDRVS